MSKRDDKDLYDTILSHIGQVGRCQRIHLMLIFLAGIGGGVQLFITIFSMETPQFRCAAPGLLNDTFIIQNEAHSQLVQAAIPFDSDKGSYSHCHHYTGSLTSGEQALNVTSRDKQACSRWVYSTEVYASTMVSELDLVCGRRIYISHANMVSLAGVMVASMVGGALSDFLGRKTTFLIMYAIQTVSGICITFIQSAASLLVTRFIVAGTGLAAYMSSFVLCMEIMAPEHRVLANTLAIIGWPLGIEVLVMAAYFMRDWKTLQLVMSCPLLVIAIGYYWLLPESPRWLITRGRYAQAREVLTDIARVNGKDLPQDLLEFGDETGRNPEHGYTGTRRQLVTFDTKSFMKLLKSWTLTVRLINLSISWGVVNMAFYGVTLNVGSLIPGNLYLNLFFFALMDILAIWLCFFTLDRIGRKLLFCACILLGGAACLTSALLVFYGGGPMWVSILLSYVGKFGVAAGFTIIWLYTAELLPTPVRQSGVGVCSFVGRLGGIVSPYVATLPSVVDGPLGEALPLIVFGASAVASGLLSLLLPETTNRKLPETVEEAENMNWRTPKARKNVYTEAPSSSLTDHHPSDSAHSGLVNKRIEATTDV